MIWLGIIVLGLIAMLLLVREIGIRINRVVPKGGINETRYVDINGSRQWISIYGKNINNPVLLYLHGGPGSPSSYVDYVVLRKLASDYTVVTWDQRNSGQSWNDGISNADVTSDMLISDGVAMTQYLLESLSIDKITLFGISWGSIFGANLVLEHPEYYNAFLAASLAIDPYRSGEYFKKYMTECAKSNPKMLELAQELDIYIDLKSQLKTHILPLVREYGYEDSLKDSDCNIVAALIFNPYMRFRNWKNFLTTNAYRPSGYDVYGILGDASIKDRKVYEVPFYLLEGTLDHGFLNMREYAEDYFNEISAPDKELRYVEGGHMMPMLKSESLVSFLHDIRSKIKEA